MNTDRHTDQPVSLRDSAYRYGVDRENVKPFQTNKGMQHFLQRGLQVDKALDENLLGLSYTASPFLASVSHLCEMHCALKDAASLSLSVTILCGRLRAWGSLAALVMTGW